MPGRHRVLGPLVWIAALLALTWAVFELVGLRIVRVSRSPVALQQGAPDEADKQVAPGAAAEVATDHPRNLVLVIADGFGFAHLTAARTVLHGINAPAVWDRFTATGWQRTHPVAGFLTDSAAAATALATGSATYYQGIGVDADGRPLETLFERGGAMGYRTGIVTDSYVWDATPAAFATHSPQRGNDNAGPALRQLGESSLEVLVGELEDVGEGEVPEWEASVELLSRRFDVFGPQSDDALLQEIATATSPTAAIFEEDQVDDLESTPTLPSLTTAALHRLSSDERPFLLLVESEEPDSASHRSDFQRLIKGLEALDATLQVVLDWAEVDGETLVVFTSDHETGGLALSIAENRNMSLQAIWATRDHTGSPVPVLAYGPGAGAFAGSRTNWELGQELGRVLRPQ